LVGFGDLFETLLGIRLFADIRMVLARKLAIRTLDVFLRGVARDTQQLVVVLEFHLGSPDTSRPAPPVYCHAPRSRDLRYITIPPAIDRLAGVDDADHG